jgi:hypothetical protein
MFWAKLSAVAILGSVACATFGMTGKGGVPQDAVCAWVDWGGFKAWICASPSELARVQTEASTIRHSKGLP